MQQAVSLSSLPVIVAGDFNMPADSTIYREVWGRYLNAFSEKGTGYGRTVFESMRGIKVGVRIDHILAGNGLGIRVCETGPDVGSDHLPLIADIGGQK
jgi:endonuclease/exonuclease/phosphatase (EEP) superfamily protein YafD